MNVQTGQFVAVADALFPKVRQRVLSLLYGEPQRSFYASELISIAQSGSGAVQRELQTLSEVGLISVRRLGRQKHYQANATAPIYPELRGLILKTVGLADILKSALLPLASSISLAFVFGSMAKSQDALDSDVDLLVVSDVIDYSDLYEHLEQASEALGRVINPTLYSNLDFEARRERDNSFIVRVLQQPKIWLIGADETLNE
jgi:predicted nucleotidyltransferase